MSLGKDICACSTCISIEIYFKPHWTWPFLHTGISEAWPFPNGFQPNNLWLIYWWYHFVKTSSSFCVSLVLVLYLCQIFDHISRVWEQTPSKLLGVLRNSVRLPVTHQPRHTKSQSLVSFAMETKNFGSLCLPWK